MKLTVIGKYGPYAPLGGSCSCYVLETDGKRIVLDMGSGSLSRLLSVVDIGDIDAVILSHLHSDHMTDIGIMGYYQDIWNAKHNGNVRLPVLMPDSPGETVEHMKIGDRFDFMTVSSGWNEVCGIRFFAVRMNHPALTFGYRFENSGKIFSFTGDTGRNECLRELIFNADLALCDTALFRDEAADSSVHLSAAEAAEAAKMCSVKKLVLTHIRPGTDEQALLEEALGVFPSSYMAEEGKTYDI